MLNVECSDGDGDDGNDWNNEGAEQYIFGIVVFNLSREGEGDGCGGLKVEWQAEALSLSGVKEGKAAVDSSPEQGTTIKMEDPQIKSNHIKRIIEHTFLTAARGVTKLTGGPICNQLKD